MRSAAPPPPPSSLSPYLSESCRNPGTTWGQRHTYRPLKSQSNHGPTFSHKCNKIEIIDPQRAAQQHKPMKSKSTLSDSLEGVDPGVPAQQLQQFIVKTQHEGDTHDAQTDVRDDGDGTELEQTGQTDHQPCEHHTGPPHLPPIHQIHNCTRRCTEKQRIRLITMNVWLTEIWS